MKKPVFRISDQAVQPKKMDVGLKEGLYYPCSENKGADQLCGHRTVDLRLCFRICSRAGFLMTWLIFNTWSCLLGREFKRYMYLEVTKGFNDCFIVFSRSVDDFIQA